MARFKTEKEYTEFLKNADKEYYQLGASSYSDEFYDSLVDELFTLYPNTKYKANVGYVDDDVKNVTHEIAMGSQKKMKTFKELEEFMENIQSKVGEVEIIGSEKLDGFSLGITFFGGKLIKVASRGNGVTGKDVTKNVHFIKNIPKSIKISHGKKLDKISQIILENPHLNVNIRGEGLISKTNFEKINIKKAEDVKKLSNPRNAVPGLFRRDDGEDCDLIDFLAYDVAIKGFYFDEKDKFAFLEAQGFTTPKWVILKSVEDIQQYWQSYEDSLRNLCIYELDGLIICVNDAIQQGELGIIDKRPRFSRAYKFSNIRVQTTVDDITWQVGRTGKVTPVANVTPIHVAGVTVSNVTLHNLAKVRDHDIRLGSTIEIIRSGDVIPKFERVLIKGNKAIAIPTLCPSCNGDLVEDEKFLMCSNSDCPAQNFKQLLHWVVNLEVEGLAESTVVKLYDAGLISKVTDFYDLTEESLCSIDRMGEKLAKKILKELHKKKTIKFPIFIKALGIPNFSDKTAELLEDKYDIHSIMNAKKEDLLSIHGIGEIVTDAILSIKDRKEEIESILKIITIIEKEKPLSSKLEGVSVCFTGVRDNNLEEFIIKNGGKISGSVSKNLTYLVAKDPTDSSEKLKKARSAGVKIVSLAEMREIVQK